MLRSLVGSEMCIRDRVLGGQELTVNILDGATIVETLVLSAAAQGDSSITLDFTATGNNTTVEFVQTGSSAPSGDLVVDNVSVTTTGAGLGLTPVDTNSDGTPDFLQTDATGDDVVAPVVIDLDGDGVEFVGLDAGFAFDVTGDGITDRTAFAAADDGILVFDANGDGTVSGPEEFVFTDFVDGAQTDLEGLAFFDTDGDGLLDADDASFKDFAVFQDANLDGIVDEGEFTHLTDLGIESIGLESDGVASVEVTGMSWSLVLQK